MCDIDIPHGREKFVTLSMMSFAGAVVGEGGGIAPGFFGFSGKELSSLKKILKCEIRDKYNYLLRMRILKEEYHKDGKLRLLLKKL